MEATNEPKRDKNNRPVKKSQNATKPTASSKAKGKENNRVPKNSRWNNELHISK